MNNNWLKMLIFILLIGFGVLATFYVAGGYTIGLRALVGLRRLTGRALDPISWARPDDSALPGITIAIPAFNEGALIADRISNLLETDYPLDKVEIYIVSDGSKDDTGDHVRAMQSAHPQVAISLEEFTQNQGKNGVQNHITNAALHDVIVFTDSETRFEPETLRALVAPLADPQIGVCGGQIEYADITKGSSSSKLYQTYRKLEDTTRSLETQLGIGCKVDGPCAAGRRGYWRVLHAHEAEDQVLPLMARQAGLKTVHVAAAIAHDVANSRPKQELVQRRRMTRKALLSFKSSWSWTDAKTYPRFTAAYVSHKILRYFLPVFLILAAIGVLGLAAQAGLFWLGVALMVGSLLASMFSASQPKYGRFLGMPYALFYSNLALLLGIWDALLGRSIGTYVPTRTIGKPKAGA